MTPVRILIAAALAAAAASCAPFQPQSLSEPPQLQTPPEGWLQADDPVVWNSFDDFAHLELSMPDAVKAQPRLYMLLRNEGVARLRAFGRESRETQTELPPAERRAYTLTIHYRAPFETSRLFSLEGGSWDYTGGAHGNPADEAVLWDKTGQRRIASAELFRPGADLTVLDRALCDAVNRAKAARSQGENAPGEPWRPVSLTPAPGADFSCPRALDMAIALTPGTVPARAGGLTVLIGPYVVGPYAEAGYGVIVPLEAFAALLSPEWADQFAGAPAPDLVVRHRAG